MVDCWGLRLNDAPYMCLEKNHHVSNGMEALTSKVYADFGPCAFDNSGISFVHEQFAINQWSKKTARRSDTVDDGKQLPYLLHDQRKDAVINTPLTANWMILKCIKLKNHVLETWMLESMSNIGSNLSIAMHLHVHNGEIMDETRLLLTGPHARWMTSDGVKLCDAGTHIGVTNDWNPISVNQVHYCSMPLTNVGIFAW